MENDATESAFISRIPSLIEIIVFSKEDNVPLVDETTEYVVTGQFKSS